MDLRVEKTKRNIINAFLNLRSHRPIEKITIREIAEIAQINKATFYLHYHDIYELTE
ncbi:MAG: TetR family transcriptional regulator, partial [Ruminococcus sp.]|nr:TetR family transcriptional regulator [Ruminococcus sp.]